VASSWTLLKREIESSNRDASVRHDARLRLRTTSRDTDPAAAAGEL
jgi:hypothetical protein